MRQNKMLIGRRPNRLCGRNWITMELTGGKLITARDNFDILQWSNEWRTINERREMMFHYANGIKLLHNFAASFAFHERRARDFCACWQNIFKSKWHFASHSPSCRSWDKIALSENSLRIRNHATGIKSRSDNVQSRWACWRRKKMS